MKKSASFDPSSALYSASSTDGGDSLTSQSSYSFDTAIFSDPFFTSTHNEATNIDLKKLSFLDPSLLSTNPLSNGKQTDGSTQSYSSESAFKLKDLVFALTYLGTISSGIAVGLISYDSQKSDDWSANLILLGGLVASTLFALVLRLGRVRVSLLSSVLLFGLSISVLFSETLRSNKRVWRFLEFMTGFASALEFVLHQIVIAESLKVPWRTICGILNITAFLFGFVFVQIIKIAPEMHFTKHFGSRELLVALNVLQLSIYLPITGRLFPETPRFLFAVKDQKTSCVRSLEWLRGKSTSIAEEYSEMADGLAYLYDAFSPTTIMTTKNKTFMDNATERVILLPLLSSMAFLLLTSLTGLQPVAFFFTPEWEFISGSSSGKLALLTIALIIISCVSSLLVSRVGVKSLLLVSASCSTGTLMFAATFLSFFNVPLSHWLAQSTIFIFIVLHFFGLGSLSWTLTIESMPVRGFELGVCLSASLWCAFLLVFNMTRLQMLSILGVNGIFWIHSLVGVVSYLFILFAIPDIKKEDSLIKIQKRYLRSNLKY